MITTVCETLISAVCETRNILKFINDLPVCPPLDTVGKIPKTEAALSCRNLRQVNKKHHYRGVNGVQLEYRGRGTENPNHPHSHLPPLHEGRVQGIMFLGMHKVTSIKDHGKAKGKKVRCLGLRLH